MGSQAEALGVQPVSLEVASQIAEDICWRLINSGTVNRVEIAGSIRRQSKDPISDIDIQAVPVPGVLDPREFLIEQPEVKKILRYGSQIASLLWDGGVPIVVDLYLTTEDAWVAHLMFLTGSKNLTIRHRAAAKHKGYKLSQNGLFDSVGNMITLLGEKQAYEILGFTWREPWERNEG